MSMQLDTCWKGTTVSEGTMRPQDLLPKFIDVIKEAEGPASEKIKMLSTLIAEAPIAFCAREELDLIYPSDDDPAWDTEEFECWFNETIWATMEEIAPDGTTFSSHEGDGACYGFWIDEDVEDGPESPCNVKIDRTGQDQMDDVIDVCFDHVHELWSFQSGGHFMLDIVHLTKGRGVLVISDDSVGYYKSMTAFWNDLNGTCYPVPSIQFYEKTA